MAIEFPTAFILLAGALAVPFFRGTARCGLLVLLPVVAFAHVLALPHGEYGRFVLAGHELIAMRVDRERHGLSDPHLADVGLADRGADS